MPFVTVVSDFQVESVSLNCLLWLVLSSSTESLLKLGIGSRALTHSPVLGPEATCSYRRAAVSSRAETSVQAVQYMMWGFSFVLFPFF